MGKAATWFSPSHCQHGSDQVMRVFGTLRPFDALRAILVASIIPAYVDATELVGLLVQLRAGNSHMGTGNITGSVSANRTSGVAPLGVILDATATGTALTAIPQHELIHIYHYGDDDLVVWANGTLSGISKKNLSQGAMGAHVFETSGTKTVRYTAAHLSSGGVLSVSATQIITITITNPDVVFAGTNTICLANGSVPVPGVNGVPAGATCASATTWAAVVGYCTTGKRVLLKSGDVWTVGTTTNFSGGITGILGKFGTGADPEISITAAAVSLISPTTSTTEDWRFMDLHTHASTLSATGTARNGTRFLQCNNKSGGGAIGGKFSTLLRINHHDASSLAHIADETVIADCHADTLCGMGGNVGIWSAHNTGLAILGCSLNDASRMEFNIRLQGIRKFVIADNYLKDPLADGTKHALALRGFSAADTSWTGVYTEDGVVRNNRIIGKSISGLVQVAPQDSGKDERHRNILIESNYISNESTTGTGTCILGGGGTNITIRNNIFQNGDCTITSNISFSNGSSIAANSYAVLPPTSIFIYNNVLYCAKATSSGTPARMVDVASTTASGWQVKNNVMYLPNHTNGSNTVALGTGIAGATVSNNSTNAQTKLTPNFVTIPPVIYSDWRTTSGYAVNGGAWVPVFTDFFGTARVGTSDMGAINPS